MKRTLLVLVIAYLAFGPQGLAKNRVVKDSLSYEGRQITYYLFAPEELDKASPAPLVVTLHGCGRNGQSLVDSCKKLAVENKLIIVGPDSANRQGWMTPVDGPDAIAALVDYLTTQHNIDARRVYLFGHSAGASFALILSVLEPDYFAATAVHAGALSNAQSLAPFFFVSERKVPVAIWVGDRDPFFPVPVVQGTCDVLKAGGVDVQLEVMKGHDHWYYQLGEKINEKAWEYLSPHRLPGDPTFRKHNFR